MREHVINKYLRKNARFVLAVVVVPQQECTLSEGLITTTNFCSRVVVEPLVVGTAVYDKVNNLASNGFFLRKT